jgi:hypothetical protein
MPNNGSNNGGTPVNIYSCDTRGKNFLNTFPCQGCGDLRGPVETVYVPKEVMAKGDVASYLSKVSKTGYVIEKTMCKRL